MARIYLHDRVITIVPGFFSLSYTANRGAAFGILQKQRALFIVLTLIVFYLIWRYYHEIPKQPLVLTGLFLALGGAVGNFIDRVVFGAVIDFLAFKYWPVFNVADSAIVVGLVLFAWGIWQYERKVSKNIGQSSREGGRE